MRRTLKRFELTVAEKPVEKLGTMLTKVKDRAPKENKLALFTQSHVAIVTFNTLVKREEHWREFIFYDF